MDGRSFPVRVSQQVADVFADRPRAVLYPDVERGPLLIPAHLAASLARLDEESATE